MPKAKTNKERIADLEAEVVYLLDMVHALNKRIRGLEIKPDPWRPIGPRPDQPSPFAPPVRPWEHPWHITCSDSGSKQG